MKQILIVVRMLMALTMGAWLTATALPAQATARKPNIILILADDLGYGDVGCFGQTRIKTPHLDQLAREGVRFTQFYSGSTVCAPARNVLMTGEHTGHALIRGNAKIDLRAADTTIAELLRDAGYATAVIGKWGLGRTGSTGDPDARGFSHAFGFIDQTHAHNYYPSHLVRNGERIPLRNVVPDEGEYGQGIATTRVDYAPDLFIAEAEAFIEKHREQPFFLYFPTTLPHANNEAGDAGMEIPDVGAYADEDWPQAEKGFAAMVTRLDTDVGRIVAAVDRLGLAGDTLIIFTSDNGPHNEGGHSAEFFDSNGPFRGTKRSLLEGGIRVPTIARWTGRGQAGASDDRLAYFPDLYTTFAELAGVTGAPQRDGISLVPAFTRPGVGTTRTDGLYWEFYEREITSQAVRVGRWKAVREPIGTGAIQLYDIPADPAESRDLAAEHPDIAARAAALMDVAHIPSPRWPTAPAK